MKRIILTLICSSIIGSSAVADNLQFMGAVPSPLGNYDRILLVGKTTPPTCTAGTLYYDTGLNALRFCGSGGNWISAGGGGVWSQTGNVVTLTDASNINIKLDFTAPIIARGLTPLGSGTNAIPSGSGIRFMWYPKKAALRAGEVTGTHWNDTSIGNYSVAFGLDSEAMGVGSVVAGGGVETVPISRGNVASGDYSVVSGGQANTAGSTPKNVNNFLYLRDGIGSLPNPLNVPADADATSLPDTNDQRDDQGYPVSTHVKSSATVGGGALNAAIGKQSTIGGGFRNRAYWESTTIGGGTDNVAFDQGSTVGGGYHNSAIAHYSTVGGGARNRAGELSVISGGFYNRAYSRYSHIGGGGENVIGNATDAAMGRYSVISGGQNNTVNGAYAAIAGGRDNQADGERSFAVGFENLAAGGQSFAAGSGNRATGQESTVFGIFSRANGNASLAVGDNAVANGWYSFAIGANTHVNGDYSGALGEANQIGIDVDSNLDGESEWNGAEGTNSRNTLIFGSNNSSRNSQFGLLLGNQLGLLESSATPLVRSQYAVVIGRGVSAGSRLVNNISNSLMVGFNSTVPTLFVGSSAGAGTVGNVGIGTSNPRARLEVSNGDVYLPNANTGIILVNVNGDCARVTLNAGGNGVNVSPVAPALKYKKSRAARKQMLRT